MNKIKLWSTTGKNQGLIIILIVFCFLMVMGLLLVWGFFSYKEGLDVRRTRLPNVGTDIRCKNEDAQANRQTYRVMTRTKIQPFPGRQKDPNQVVAKSWGVNENELVIVNNCRNINRVRDNTGNVKKFKYKVNVDDLEGGLVRCRQSAPGSNRIPPGNHTTNAVYIVEGKKLRWYQNVANAYSSLENIISWGWDLRKTQVVDVPSCDDIKLGGNIRYNAQKLPEGTYTKCSIDVSGGVGTNQVYRVGSGGVLSWTVSDEIASFFYPGFQPNAYGYYPDCSSFTRGDDITKGKVIKKDYNKIGTNYFTIPFGCIGIHAITVGGGGGGGGGSGGWHKIKDKDKDNGQDCGGGAGGGGGGGAVVFYNNNYYVTIDDSNRNSRFFVYVGKGGKGGKKGDHNVNGGNNKSGQDGEPSFIGIANKVNYFVAFGGKAGEKGQFAKNYRGRDGNGGYGGAFINPENKYFGNNGSSGEIAAPHINEPYINVEGGNGGYPVGIPGDVPGREGYGIGGKGGTGSDKAYDGATEGGNGTNGFVRVILVF